MLPKSLRQSIQLFACAILIGVGLSSCVDKIKTDLVAFKALDEGLAASNAVINAQNQILLASISDRINVPETDEKASDWPVKARQIHSKSKIISDYINELKLMLKKEAGLETHESIESFKESDKNAVMRVFMKQKKGEMLYEKLLNYKKDIFTIDPNIATDMGYSIIITTRDFDSGRNTTEVFTKTFFDDIPVIAAIAILTKFDNNIKVIENRIFTYCISQKSAVRFRHPGPPVAIAAASSNFINANQTLEITAGIGSFQPTAGSSVVIDGKVTEIEWDGFAHYRLKTPAKRGPHSIPVRITYIDLDGLEKRLDKQVDYVVN